VRTLRLVLPHAWTLTCLLPLACGDDSGVGESVTTFTSTVADTSSDGGSVTVTTTVSTTDVETTAGSADESSGGTTTGVDTTGMPDTSGEGTSTTGMAACDDVDIPDINGLDENGDGIDGVVCRAVFVNGAVGSDLNEGLMPDEPVATIARGIEIAQTYQPPRMVLVAEGNYVETVNVNSGVSLYGGYDGGDWSRNVGGNLTEITATENRAIIAQNLDQEVEIDGFTIYAQSYVDGGQTSYGVWVRDTPDGLFTLDYCVVEAGNGGLGADGEDGANGQDGGNATSAGGNGTNGQSGVPGMGGTSACNATGGNGGSGQACPATSGGDGSAGGDPTTVGTGGARATSATTPARTARPVSTVTPVSMAAVAVPRRRTSARSAVTGCGRRPQVPMRAQVTTAAAVAVVVPAATTSTAASSARSSTAPASAVAVVVVRRVAAGVRSAGRVNPAVDRSRSSS